MTALPSDRPPAASVTAPGRVLVLACGALAREITALIDLNGWTHLELACLPAILHNTPDRIPDAVRQAVAARGASYERIFLAYGDCGTGGRLDRVCAELGLERLPGAHCYAFFAGVDDFEARAEQDITVFYLTDFLARQFDAFVIRPLGLDRHPDLRDMYFGHYERLVYLAQTEDPILTRQAEAAAHRLGLAFERRFTGFGDLAGALATA